MVWSLEILSELNRRACEKSAPAVEAPLGSRLPDSCDLEEELSEAIELVVELSDMRKRGQCEDYAMMLAIECLAEVYDKWSLRA